MLGYIIHLRTTDTPKSVIRLAPKNEHFFLFISLLLFLFFGVSLTTLFGCISSSQMQNIVQHSLKPNSDS